MASGIVDPDAAREAIELAMPTIERVMRHPGAGDSGCLHVVVMDPLAGPERSSFEASILHEASVNRANWDADYARYARAKARLAWRNRMDGAAVQALRPALLAPGDTLLWGSVWLDGIAVGVSGLEAWYDEAVATCVAGFVRAVAKSRAHTAIARGAFLDGSPLP